MENNTKKLEITMPTITMAMIVSQLTGTPALTAEQLNKMMADNKDITIEIEIPAGDNDEQSESGKYTFASADSLKTIWDNTIFRDKKPLENPVDEILKNGRFAEMIKDSSDHTMTDQIREYYLDADDIGYEYPMQENSSVGKLQKLVAFAKYYKLFNDSDEHESGAYSRLLREEFINNMLTRLVGNDNEALKKYISVKKNESDLGKNISIIEVVDASIKLFFADKIRVVVDSTNSGIDEVLQLFSNKLNEEYLETLYVAWCNGIARHLDRNWNDDCTNIEAVEILYDTLEAKAKQA